MVNDIIYNGYLITNIIEKINIIMTKDNKLKDKQKSLISIRMAELDYDILKNGNIYIQLISLFHYIQSVIF